MVHAGLALGADGDGAGAVDSFEGMVGSHPAITAVADVVRRVAPTNTTVLVTGETGSGKELVARAIHRLGPRRGSRFVPVHCGAIPEELLESEMFGHERGAFTGAVMSRVGRFRLADGGTIFLDEIGDMSPKLQVKLLRVLEDGRFEPVGSVVTQQVDVRVLAATNQDLETAVSQGRFREDLYYRLCVVPIVVPPLRQRREDIPLLAEHFLGVLHAKGLQRCRLVPETISALSTYPWPGNVRELRNVLEQMVVLGSADGWLRLSDLPPHIRQCGEEAGPSCPSVAPWDFGRQGIDFYREMEAIEDRIIARALHLSGGNKKEAARLLRVNRTTLLEKLKRKRAQAGRVPSGDRLGLREDAA